MLEIRKMIDQNSFDVIFFSIILKIITLILSLQITITQNRQYNKNQYCMTAHQPEPIVVDFKQNPEPYVIQSLCVQCGQNGQTVLLMTKIPFFKDIMISSFTCQDCGNKNNQVQFIGELPSHGLVIDFKATKKQDLNREIIKSEHATIYIKELDLEIPESKKAQITTLQGLLLRVEEELSHDQEARKQADSNTHQKISVFLQKLRSVRNGQCLPFNIKISDPSGNSNIKNPYAPKLDEHLMFAYPPRTLQQIEKMGYSQNNAKEGKKEDKEEDPMKKKKQNTQVYESHQKMDFTQPMNEQNFLAYEPSVFDIDCHACSMPGQMKMCSTNIPYFSDLVIMSFSCDFCGAHTTDTKNSGEIGELASTITLNAEGDKDLKRDLFKSETCKVSLPDLELELDYGTLGGVFTTVQGLLEKIKSHLSELNGFTDSDGPFWSRMNEIFVSMEEMMSGQRKFTMIMRDPLDRSFLQNPNHPEEDHNAKVEKDERTEEEIEYLGLDTMKL